MPAPEKVSSAHKKTGHLFIPFNVHGISATRLSQGDPLGFPSHPRGWFSIVAYQVIVGCMRHFPVETFISNWNNTAGWICQVIFEVSEHICIEWKQRHHDNWS